MLNSQDPQGLYEAIRYLAKTFKKPLLISEWGFATKGESSMSVEEAVADSERCFYYTESLDVMRKAIEDGIDLRGSLAWSKHLPAGD